MKTRKGFRPLGLTALELRRIVEQLDKDDAGDGERVELWVRRRGRKSTAKFRYMDSTYEVSR